MPFTNWLWIFLCIQLFAKSSAQPYANGTFVNTPLCKKSGVQCADDCLTLLTCGNINSTPIKTELCPATSTKTPYCKNNGCSATIGACPVTAAPIFHCTDTGIYPDPDDCTRHRHCTSVGILASYYQCPAGFNFNSKNGLCDKIAACDTVHCSVYDNQILTFKSNPRFYCFCYKAPSGRISFVYKCSENLIFSSTKQTCGYSCVSSGMFKDLTNCHAYFVCTGTVGSYTWKWMECPQSYFFNGTTCVKELSPCSHTTFPPIVTTTKPTEDPITPDPDENIPTKPNVDPPPIDNSTLPSTTATPFEPSQDLSTPKPDEGSPTPTIGPSIPDNSTASDTSATPAEPSEGPSNPEPDEGTPTPTVNPSDPDDSTASDTSVTPSEPSESPSNSEPDEGTPTPTVDPSIPDNSTASDTSATPSEPSEGPSNPEPDEGTSTIPTPPHISTDKPTTKHPITSVTF